MKKHFDRARWIWIEESAGADEYGEFVARFDADEGQSVCRVSCDGDYTLWINGAYVASNQYGDYEHYKIYDELDVTPYIKVGENELHLLVWHIGENSLRYACAAAGVIFEVEQGGNILLVSDESVLCRKSAAYKSGYRKKITSQLGFSFLYDSRLEGEGELKCATPIVKNCEFFARPIDKLTLLPLKEGKILKSEGNYYLVDLGEETLGLVSMDFFSDTEQKITVCWGEDLQDGHVRRRIGPRDFSLEYIATVGENSYANYMLRLGCRYIELYAEEPITLRHLGLIPQIYPAKGKAFWGEDALDRRIYELCVRTLKLCMMEHYVDTPWREQSLYAFDSRNQMLCGYRAFEGGNAEYARSNLLLISKDRRPDELLSICYPSGSDLAIPSFSLYYFTAIREYLDFTGDLSLIEEVYPKLISVFGAFSANRRDRLVCRFGGASHWNFYDWSRYLEGNLGKDDKPVPDLMINCLFIMALENLRVISERAGKPFDYEKILAESRKATEKAFYDEQKDAYSLTVGGGEFTTLGNAMAVLAGVARDPAELCRRITEKEFSECSLSMKCFEYDALIRTDEARWRPYILAEIRENYGKMLGAGATSVWETIDGASAFGNAGSLCHGWSAVPICYL